MSAPTQIARGLRNVAGMVFDDLGNLWLQDNGIDTEGNRGVSFSADELNRVNAADLGTSVPNFGFADTYVRYSVGPTAGVFNQGGAANDENPVAFVDPQTGAIFHFIENGLMGHPNGMLATDAGLFVTDLNPTGRFGDPIGAGGTVLTLNGVEADRAGAIYLVAPTVAPVPEPSTWAMAVAALACGGFGMARRTRSRQA